MQTKISIVSPLFNEEDNIKKHYNELCENVKKLQHFTKHEIIFVNDGSYDNSLKIIKKLASKDKNLKIISFTRNFGHEAASTAGLKYASGDATVLIDADRQDPPELILDFEKKYLTGYDIVYAQRSKRLNESFIKKITSKAFYPIFKYITKIDIPRDTGDYCLLSKKALNIINKKLLEKKRFIRGLIYWTGLPKKGIFFVRRSRGGGKTKYNYSKLTIFALENIISYSTVPIHLILFFSLFLFTTSLIGISLLTVLRILKIIMLNSTLVLVLFLTLFFSINFIILSILGLYIGNAFKEIKNRPTFLIDEKINFDQN